VHSAKKETWLKAKENYWVINIRNSANYVENINIHYHENYNEHFNNNFSKNNDE